MDSIKLFHIVSEITMFYSNLALKLTSLDSFLTIQIITECQLDPMALNLSKGELAIFKKITAFRAQSDKNNSITSGTDSFPTCASNQTSQTSLNVATKQKELDKFFNPNTPKLEFPTCTLVAIHEFGDNYTRLQKSNLTKNLMKKIDNIIIVQQSLSINNNLLHFDGQMKLGRPMIVVVVDQARRVRQQSTDEKIKKHNYLMQEMQRYLSVCDIFYGHINLRVCLYRQENIREVYNREKLAGLIKISVEHQDSEDDLDILLREQIPHNAYIKIVNQCGNRVSKQHIRTNPQSYTLISETENYYSFKVAKDQPKNALQATDQLLIWVLIDDRPLLRLLPSVNSSKNKSFLSFRKGKAGSKNDRFEEKRSLLGYTYFQMEDKLNGKKTQNNIMKAQSDGKIDNQSQQYANSQCGNSSELSQQPEQLETEQNIVTYIINIDKKVNERDREKLVEEQMKNIFGLVLKQRKQVHQNMEVNRSMLMVSKIASILQVDEQDVYQVVFVNKL